MRGFPDSHSVHLQRFQKATSRMQEERAHKHGPSDIPVRPEPSEAKGDSTDIPVGTNSLATEGNSEDSAFSFNLLKRQDISNDRAADDQENEEDSDDEETEPVPKGKRRQKK